MIHIIGGGPAGLFLGESIKTHDPSQQVIIYEEHGTIGMPVQCTGILTPEIHTLISLPASVIANRVKKARIHARDGKHLDVTFEEPDVILHRDRFDQWLASRAEKRGCAIKKGWRLGAIRGKALLFSKKKGKNSVALHQGDIVVGCDGPDSRVAHETGLFEGRKWSFGIQATVEARHDNAIQFYPFIGDYAWLCPEGPGRARIGVEAKKDPGPLFEAFAGRFHGRIISRQAGLIPTFRPGIKKQTARDDVAFFLVGDAAGQVKNTTGGGIVAAMKAARVLGKLIAEGREQRYTQAIKRDVTRGLYLHYLARKRMQRFSDEDWNRLITTFNKPALKRVLSRVHRDSLAAILPRLVLEEPRLLRYALFP